MYLYKYNCKYNKSQDRELDTPTIYALKYIINHDDQP